MSDKISIDAAAIAASNLALAHATILAASGPDRVAKISANAFSENQFRDYFMFLRNLNTADASSSPPK